jgi:hypothetical protein
MMILKEGMYDEEWGDETPKQSQNKAHHFLLSNVILGVMGLGLRDSGNPMSRWALPFF